MARTVLITGASTGIGADAAGRMRQRGWRVIAGVRKLSDVPEGDNIVALLLDVTDAAQISAAQARIAELTGGRLDALVNNAGVAIAGPLELLPLSALRQQFEINVIGLIAVTQAMLPFLRAAKGRIVNISSIAGRSAAPVSGAYSGSKFAVEALSDALRMEMAPFGVQVALVEPGAIRTPIWEKSLRQAEERHGGVDPELYKLYEPIVEGVRQRALLSMKRGSPASAVSDAIEHALTSRKPRTRYVVGRDAKLRLVLNRLPDRWQDSIILKALRPKQT